METQNILAILLLIVTAIYAIITFFQLKESRKVRFQKETPNIVAYLQSTEDHETLALHIKNFGEGVAKNVKVTFLKDFNRFDKEDFPLSDIGIAKKGLNYFPPDYDLSYHIGRLVSLYENNREDVIKLKISCESLDDRKFSNTFELPIAQVYGVFYSNPPETYMGQIPHYLEKISKELETFNNKNV